MRSKSVKSDKFYDSTKPKQFVFFLINCMQLKLKACRMCTVVMKRYKNDQGRITILQIFGWSKRNILLTKQCMFFLLFVVFSRLSSESFSQQMILNWIWISG